MPAKTSKPKVKQTKRQLEAPQYKSFRLSKRIRTTKKPLPSAYKLLKQSLKHLKQHWRLFGGITLVYAVLTLVLVRGLASSSEAPFIRDTIQDLFPGRTGQVAAGVTVFGFLIGSASTAPTEITSFYQAILMLITSLALIWALRQSYAKTKVSIRDAFYKGMYPLVPFLLVLLVVGLQLVPFAAGNSIFTIVLSTGIAATDIEKVIWGIFFFLLTLLSLYLIASSVFALYISTLPNMQPLMALRSARQLVLHRRWQVLRKLLFLPLVLLVLSAIIIIPVIFVSTLIAEWLFFVGTMAVLAIVHTYIYSLYRELL
jgi:hypothetical protein